MMMEEYMLLFDVHISVERRTTGTKINNQISLFTQSKKNKHTELYSLTSKRKLQNCSQIYFSLLNCSPKRLKKYTFKKNSNLVFHSFSILTFVSIFSTKRM